MPRGKPPSAAHKAAISAGMKRYWATRHAGSGGGGSSLGARAAQHIKPNTSPHLETGKQISREAAAAIMFGTRGAAKKIAASKKKRKR